MKSLDDIFGQDAAVRWLGAMMKSPRVHHALLFAGPPGVGKATTAAALAAIFLCEKSEGGVACGACESCNAMHKESHPDYHVIYRQLIRLEKSEAAARDLAVDTIRRHLIEPAGLKSSRGRGKVFVVEEADTMNLNSQNALLKTLEEPPGRTLIILLTDSPDYLLPTIRSRSQLVQFGYLPIDRVRSELIKRGIDAKDAADAAEMSEGSIGLALRWLEDGVVAAGRELLASLDELPGSAMTLSGWFKQFAEAYVKTQQAREDAKKKRTNADEGDEHEEKISKDVTIREGLHIMLRLAAGRFRQQLASAGYESEPARCEQIEATFEAARYLDRNVNVALVMENLVMRWSRAFG